MILLEIVEDTIGRSGILVIWHMPREAPFHASATFYSLSSLMNMNRKLTNSRQQENQMVLMSNIRMK